MWSKCLLSIYLRMEIWMNYRKLIKLPHLISKQWTMRMTLFKFLLRFCLTAETRSPILLTSLLKHRLLVCDVYYKKLLVCCCVNKNRKSSTTTEGGGGGDMFTIIMDTKNGCIRDRINCTPEDIVIIGPEEGCVYITKGKPNYQIWYRPFDSREPGSSDTDKLLYQTKSTSSGSVALMLRVTLSRDQQHIIITSSTRLTSEVHTIPVSQCGLPSAAAMLVHPSVNGIHYYIDHAHGRWYMITNKDSSNGGYKEFPLKWTELSSCSIEGGTCIIQDVEFFRNLIIIYGNTTSVQPVLYLIDPATDNNNHSPPILIKSMEFMNYTMFEPSQQPYDSNIIKGSVSSPVSHQIPYVISNDNSSSFQVTHSCPLETAKHSILRRFAKNEDDGTDIPITLIQRRGTPNDTTGPLLALVYGYRESIVSLLNRSWTIAYCHVRGGNELGLDWFLQTTGRNKSITHEDLYYCLTYLHESGYSHPDNTALMGRSSGGIAVGNFCNRWPHLLQAAILDMPHVNLTRSLIRNKDNLSLVDHLDKEEFSEGSWLSGSSLENDTLIESICPYFSLQPKDYPSILVLASLCDELIDICGIDEYVARLRTCIELHHQRTSVSNDHHDCLYIPRGTVVYEKFHNVSHYEGSFNRSFRMKQELLKLLFLVRTIS